MEKNKVIQVQLQVQAQRDQALLERDQAKKELEGAKKVAQVDSALNAKVEGLKKETDSLHSQLRKKQDIISTLEKAVHDRLEILKQREIIEDAEPEPKS